MVRIFLPTLPPSRSYGCVWEAKILETGLHAVVKVRTPAQTANAKFKSNQKDTWRLGYGRRSRSRLS